MDILIKDMKRPQTCFKCKLSRIIPSIYIFCPLNEKCYPADEMPSDCPLVPVPPHGRLIDADALLMRINHEVMEAYMDGACYGVHPSQEYLYLLGEIIDDASTVIPASEEGET